MNPLVAHAGPLALLVVIADDNVTDWKSSYLSGAAVALLPKPDPAMVTDDPCVFVPVTLVIPSPPVLGDGLLDGLSDRLALLDGLIDRLALDDGLDDPDGLIEADGDTDALAELDGELDGLTDADGDDCGGRGMIIPCGVMPDWTTASRPMPLLLPTGF